MSDKIELVDIAESDELYKLVLLCNDCGKQLNETSEMSGKEIKNLWTDMVLASGLVTGKCPNGCRSTYSDLNINTKLRIVKV